MSQSSSNPGSFYGEFSQEDDPQSEANYLLREVQKLNFKVELKDLMMEFHHLLDGHLTLTQVVPEAISETGKVLMADGAFHEQWGRVLSRRNMKEHFPVYYQTVYDKITRNHTQFEDTFNPIPTDQGTT